MIQKLICCNASVYKNTQVSGINNLITTSLLVSHQEQNLLALRCNKNCFAFSDVALLGFCVCVCVMHVYVFVNRQRLQS